MERKERGAAFVEDLPVSEGEPVARSKEEAVTSKATVTNSKVKCELQITEDLDEFADVGQKKKNELEEIPQPPIPKLITKTIIKPKQVPKSTPVKKKLEPKSVGPMKEEESASWNGITLNRCLTIAAFAALISVGFQVLQEVADEDELTDLENEPWTPSDPNDQLQSDSWFFEGWFGSSEKDVSDVNLPEVELPEVKNDESVEDEINSVEETLQEDEEEEALKVDTEVEKNLDKVEKTEQWDLKDKSEYMETKALEIHRASEEESHKGEVFPFMKKTKEPSKYKEKTYKEREFSHEHKYEHYKKQDEGKSYKKDKEEHKKYFTQEENERYKGWKADKEKGWKADKEKGWKADKEYKHYQYDKGFKKSQDNRRHG
ncbi:uncharacterized protein jsrp1.S [Xenopus laevis]|uniref:Uncharacterized protein jsrp1.S n=2 Tax=Xenopus laevis TaxID=8355 RepID=A0A1L8HNF5_XENLA|nr:uncharacterized protein jsrp1.S [Xenopus laevis]XP_018099127.1 uncharacterized protein jsrp1.S [Xenopus laevis]OCT97623.1 hypothetical protein XELAEV_18009852mg [Xenopus laevis]